MSRPGRNDPCPCGSGKKYKKCCLGREVAAAPDFDALGPAEKALVWIDATFPGALGAAVTEGFFGDPDEEILESLRELPDGLQSMLLTNAQEWGLAEGLDAEGRRFIDHVLSSDGPTLSEADLQFLNALASTSLDLYEVVGVEPGRGLTLHSKTDPMAEPVFVAERTASSTLREGDHLGARVLRMEPAILSGAVYPFTGESYLHLRAEIFRDGRRKRPEPEHVAFAIIDQWLTSLVAPPPRIVDASTGKPLALTTVHYRIRDLDALSHALDSEPDVVRDGKDGWVVLDDAEAKTPRPLFSLTRNERGRLEVFARTLERADEAEAWIAERAGAAVQKVTREIVDPRSLWKEARKRPRKPTPDPVMARLSLEERTELAQRIFEQVYADWTDQPIPHLKNKTPRQAVRSKAGRREVLELLRVYETDERRRAEVEGRTPANLDFLRDELGLERE